VYPSPDAQCSYALYPKLAQSSVFTNDTHAAKFHIIRHRENWKPGEGVEVVEWMRAHYPPWNASAASGEANFLLFHVCDMSASSALDSPRIC
jgi:hypothetical protein